VKLLFFVILVTNGNNCTIVQNQISHPRSLLFVIVLETDDNPFHILKSFWSFFSSIAIRTWGRLVLGKMWNITGCTKQGPVTPYILFFTTIIVFISLIKLLRFIFRVLCCFLKTIVKKFECYLKIKSTVWKIPHWSSRFYIFILFVYLLVSQSRWQAGKPYECTGWKNFPSKISTSKDHAAGSLAYLDGCSRTRNQIIKSFGRAIMHSLWVGFCF
jgi:hypothetical protein